MTLEDFGALVGSKTEQKRTHCDVDTIVDSVHTITNANKSFRMLRKNRGVYLESYPI